MIETDIFINDYDLFSLTTVKLSNLVRSQLDFLVFSKICSKQIVRVFNLQLKER